MNTFNHIQSQIRLPNQKSIEDEAKQSTEIQRVLGIVTILGRAEGSNLQSWTLDYSVAGLEPPNFTPIQFSNQPPQMSQLGQWDTTQVIDGDYLLRLRVTDTNVIALGEDLHELYYLQTSYREEMDINPSGTFEYGLYPAFGYFNESNEYPAMSNRPSSWPVNGWPSIGRDTKWPGEWDGRFGRGVIYADMETYFVANQLKKSWKRNQ